MKSAENIEKVKTALLCMQRYSWEQGVSAQAFLEMGWDDLVILMSESAVLRQDKMGRLAVMEAGEAVTDPASNGEPLLRAAELTGNKKFSDAAERNLEYLLKKAPKNAEGILYHWPGKRIVMVDSYYMAPPFLAAMGCYDEAIKQIMGFKSLLWDQEHKLFYHMWNDEKRDFERKVFWGVGNGWAAAGITRVIRMLPDSMSTERDELIDIVKNLIDGFLRYRRDDGFFHDILDDPDSFIDSNSAQALAYTVYRAVESGWLNKTYLEIADTVRTEVYKKIDKFGIIHDVCAAPTFDYQGIAPEAQAFFLLMEAAYMDIK